MLPFPLANFPATFGIPELCRRFFPHKFCAGDSSHTNSTPKKISITKDPCHPKICTIPMVCLPKRKSNSNVGTKRRSMPITTLSCNEEYKLTANPMSNYSRKDVKSFATSSPLPLPATLSGEKKLVPTDTIASQPPQGWYGSRSNQSIKAFNWLAWCEHQLPHSSGDRIRTVRNRGEVRIANHLVDGFDMRDPVTHRPTVYEFHGCLWHGCPRCFPKDRDWCPIAHAGRTLHEVYECTLRKHDQLQQQGYDVKVQWECDWDNEVKNNQQLQQFLSTFEIIDPLQPRKCLLRRQNQCCQTPSSSR